MIQKTATEPTPETLALMKGLTVGQLREALSRYSDETPVIVYGEHGQDGESPASGVSPLWYAPKSTWSGDCYLVGPDADGETYEPDGTAVRAVFIEPIN